MSKITHVGVLVHDIEGAIEKWSQLFGMKVVKRLEVPQEGVYSAFLSKEASQDGFFIELAQPIDPADPNNYLACKLRKSGEGLLHICFVEDDMHEVRSRFERSNTKYIETVPVTSSGDNRFFTDRTACNNVMVEVLSAREWDLLWAEDR